MTRYYTEAERRQIVTEYIASGLTQAEFAKLSGVSDTSLTNWTTALYGKGDLDPFVLSP